MYVHFTDEQKQAARETDLVAFLQRRGEGLKRSGSEYEWKDGSAKVTVRGIQNSVSGLAGFAASLIGSGILAAVQRNNNQICGITVYGQQVLSAISLGIVLITIAFTREVVEKQERVIQ